MDSGQTFDSRKYWELLTRYKTLKEENARLTTAIKEACKYLEPIETAWSCYNDLKLALENKEAK